MNQQTLLETSQQLAHTYFTLPPAAEGPMLDLEMLVTWLRPSISQLLSEDFEKLVNIMYRMDVPEHRFHVALHGPNPALAIAELVVKRLILKARTRIAYRNAYQEGEQ